MKHCSRILLLAALLFVSSGAAVSGTQPPQGDRFLGFEIGEERRYVMGSDNEMAMSVRGRWSILLEEVFEVDGGREALFVLDHEWQAGEALGEIVIGRIRNVKSEGYVRVNAYGFPLMIQFHTTRHLDGMGVEGYTVDFTLDEDGKRYEKRTTLRGERWNQSVGVRNHDTIDREGRSGLFTFLPTAPGCLDSLVQRYDQSGSTYLAPRSAGSSGTPMTSLPRTLKVTDNSDCEESMFAHLGLLSLAMPAFWEAQGEREYVFFTPVGPEGSPDSRVALGAGSAGSPYGPGSVNNPGSLGPNMNRLEAPMLSAASYYDTETLKFVERVSVRIGSRTVDAWLVELSSRFGPIYVDDDGGVIRMDLPSQGDIGLYIRMLWPSEF